MKNFPIPSVRPNPGVASRRFLLLAILTLAGILGSSSGCWASPTKGDRFSLRGGIWPHRAISAIFGSVRLSPADTTHYQARLAKPASIAPFIEIQGLFHIRNSWWAEGDLGWSGRRDVDVAGFAPEDKDTVLLGIGRIDFFPIFAGVRAMHEFGNIDAPHNIYARAGLSMVIANESPSHVHDTLMKYHFYDPGSKLALGFAVGTGVEVHYLGNFFLVADVAYRYTKFDYANRGKIDLSGFWISAGITLRTH
ncbi:MAG: outer membrane beta-barrel protein [candidate division Zixibacteria bacterium]|nr:outer membrane beta-barrel protein [candidate division Zixibacteria bacterium]